jgi:hypothetical protein
MSEKDLKQFVFNALLFQDSTRYLESTGISVLNKDIEVVSRVSEEDFSPRITYDAKKMSSVYILFFSVENSVRELIIDRLAERHGANWWDNCVPKKIQDSVDKLKNKEQIKKYHSPRSGSMIGYTMFGNLGQIIISNWDDFSDLFPDQAWISSRFNDLEMSRNVIMHTGMLENIDIERIESIVRDWLRQVG